MRLDEETVLVVDGRPLPGLASGPRGPRRRLRVLYADRPGPNAADDRIVAFVTGLVDPNTATVVTSDRDLARRVATAGALVVPAKAFRARLEDRLRMIDRNLPRS